jgi:hypothetical protein
VVRVPAHRRRLFKRYISKSGGNMHYFLGGLAILILIMALPPKSLFAIAIFVTISALIIQTSASIATKDKVPFSKSIKAVLYSIVFSGVAILIVVVSGGAAFIISPFLLWGALAYAYSLALEINFLGSAIIAMIVMAAGALTMMVFKISMLTIA